MALTDSGRLGCGREIDDVWANIQHEPNEHESTCSDCQAARENLAGLATATTQLVDTDENDSRLVNRPGAVAAIMAIARAEVRRGRTLPLLRPSADDSGNSGELTVSEQAVVSIIRETSDGFDDVEGRRCRVRVADDESDQTPGDADHPLSLVVELSLTVAATVPIPPLVTELRRRITDAVERRVGVRVASIAIHVEDLHDV